MKSIGVTAFKGKFSKIVIGSDVKEIGSSAFISGASSGKMYVNLGVPLNVNGSVIVDDNTWASIESKWTLYVPKGSRGAYMKKAPWNKFKSIVEDSSLSSGNGTSGGDDGDDNPEDPENPDKPSCDYKSLTYEINGKSYKMVLVEDGPNGDFYIMQTEVLANSYLKMGGYYIGVLNSNNDGGVIKGEFRTFLDNLRDITGIAFRLPTSAEWLYAAKGGNKSRGYQYCGSDILGDVAWYGSNSSGTAHGIAAKKPNELGLYDMSGNFGEICNDTADEYYIDGGIYGGCWNDVASDCKKTSWKEGSTSGKIPGTSLHEKNAFNSKYVTVRLVYSVPE